jgi:hypothetical protein
MLQIVMPAEPLQPLFVDFLQAQTEYKVVNFDQWTSFLRFTQDVRFSYLPLPRCWRPACAVLITERGSSGCAGPAEQPL